MVKILHRGILPKSLISQEMTSFLHSGGRARQGSRTQLRRLTCNRPVVDTIKQGNEALPPAWESQNLLATRPAQGDYPVFQRLNRCLIFGGPMFSQLPLPS